ncbi:MAG: DNA cytosine methyltransferase [Clostridiales Family XIII bacterium]|jgi:DNA (cytosine-5)-methyltransferase 1|nr:DNA cytosine methyltransferase [Clostridiales Family XIII bacterium]
MSFTAIDLFAGIGGFRIAIEKCGGNCIAFSEINADAINTYNDNFHDSAGTNLGDITKLEQLPAHDFLTAGVPCQSWSIAGRNLGFDDHRGQLWNDAIFLLRQAQPKAFIFENVKGLADPRNKNALHHILGRIEDAGYHAKYFVLNAYDYGVPQSRVRIYIIGFRDVRFLSAFQLPKKAGRKLKLADIMDNHAIEVDASQNANGGIGSDNLRTSSSTSLSSNNNGFNDYFLFNDLRNGPTTIHSWDIVATTKRQKDICLYLLRNRRKRQFGPLDGNPLSLQHFQSLDKTITMDELGELVCAGILKREKYRFRVYEGNLVSCELSEPEKIILSKRSGDCIIPDTLVCDREIKISKINISEVLGNLEQKGAIGCSEERYDFRYTKISTGLFGINRVFLPSSNIFPTLVASDSNDYLTPLSITAFSEEQYRQTFLEQVLAKKQYRKISMAEACRIQGFPDGFILPDSRPRWMRLVGNSVAVPLVEQLIKSIVDTGVFHETPINLGRTTAIRSEENKRDMKDAHNSYSLPPTGENNTYVQISMLE